MQAKQASSGMTQGQSAGPPAWVLPVAVVAIIAGLIAIGHKREEAVANPLVDLMVIAVGVAGMWWVFRYAAVKGGWPGVATFFGASTQSPSNAAR